MFSGTVTNVHGREQEAKEPAEISCMQMDDDFETGSETSDRVSFVDESQGGEKLNLAKEETVAVARLRVMVFLVLLLAAVTVSTLIFIMTRSAENDEYQSQYDAASKKVLETFIEIAGNKLAAVSAMGVAIIAHGVDHVRTWPFVTLSSFQQRSSTALKQSGAIYLHINPMVSDEHRDEWEHFVVGEDSYWVKEGLDYQKETGLLKFEPDSHEEVHIFNGSDSWPIWRKDSQGHDMLQPPGSGPYMPTWQTSPVFHQGSSINENLIMSPLGRGLDVSLSTQSVVIGDFVSSEPGDIHSSNPLTAAVALMLSSAENKPVEYGGDPFSQIFLPIFDSFRPDRKPVAVMSVWVHWMSYFKFILPSTLDGIFAVLYDSCSGAYTYEINGEDVQFVGPGDLHDPRFDDMRRSGTFDAVSSIGDGTKHGLPLNNEFCMVSIDVYPSEAFHQQYNTTTPLILTGAVALIFFFTTGMFVFYNRYVEWRQALVMHKALQTNAIVMSLFPENVRDRLMKQTPGLEVKSGGFLDMPGKRKLTGCLNDSEKRVVQAPTIADLFPNCTVLFADIAGFTAWSSTRDPEQVFELLQTLYQSFDRIAKRRKVFKVETIGDSYLAVCGLPEAEPQHAVVMVRFAWECLQKMKNVTRELECTLGPETGDLSMRLGLHSGPVTAGILRGERARFQLFGDTVNTASRMESNGVRGQIQVSQVTASLLIDADKEHWLTAREDKIMAKGKGILQTFFVDPTKKRSSSVGSEDNAKDGSFSEVAKAPTLRNDRLINWMVELLMEDITKIVNIQLKSGMKEESRSVSYFPPKEHSGIHEVKAVIEMPKYEPNNSSIMTVGNTINRALRPEVIGGLREYVATIASLYRKENQFHNFEHACHVTMSVKKLLKRISESEVPTDSRSGTWRKPEKDQASRLHDFTYGITSDPLLSLALTFSALIHDVDHRGVSNARLIIEDAALGVKYSNQSVAEQHSLALAWEILMQDRFDSLRRCLFVNEAALRRFRQIVANAVLATDIFDKELNDLRRQRWELAFHPASAGELSSRNGNDRSSTKQNGSDSDLRATIVIEHIIQASDVCHTMQHWHVYRKWNERLFTEVYMAYRQGRSTMDPSVGWYAGELVFFDHYVIPLAKKLKECGVFGVSSDEYLNYAIQNRAEWEQRGESIVEGMIAEVSESEDLTSCSL